MADTSEQDRIRIRARARARVAAQAEDTGDTTDTTTPARDGWRTAATTLGGVLGGMAVAPAAGVASVPTMGIGGLAIEAGGVGVGAAAGGQLYDMAHRYFYPDEPTPDLMHRYKQQGADVVENAAMVPAGRSIAKALELAGPFVKGTKAIPVVEPYVRPVLNAAGDAITATTSAVKNAANSVGGAIKHSRPVQYVLQSDAADAAAAALKAKTSSSINAAASTAQNEAEAARTVATAAQNEPVATPAIAAATKQYVLAGSKVPKYIMQQKVADKTAAALQSQADKTVIPAIGVPKTAEEIGTPVQAELVAAKDKEAKDASQAWVDATEKVNAVDVANRQNGITISSQPKFQAFMAQVKNQADRKVGNTDRVALYKYIQKWLPEKNASNITATDVMELKRKLGDNFATPGEVGYKSIQGHEEQDLYHKLDDILNTYLTDTGGATPYANRNDAYTVAKDSLGRFNTRFGKIFTGENRATETLAKTPTQAANALVSDPQAVREAIDGGASAQTVSDAVASHIENQFQGKTTQQIIDMTQPKSQLRNVLKNNPELSDLNKRVDSYIQQRMDADMNQTKIGDFTAKGEASGVNAEKAAKARTAAKADFTETVKTRKELLESQFKAADTIAAGKEAELSKIQGLQDELASERVRDNPDKIIQVAKKHFAGDQKSLDEIDKVERTIKSAAGRAKAIKTMALLGFGAAGFERVARPFVGFIP